MTPAALPAAFSRRMTAQLGNDTDAYFACLAQPPVRGLRINPLKATGDAPGTAVDGIGQPIPWCRDGFTLTAESTAGAHPFHEAGAYYLQEPSAMAPAAVLAVQPGETVLDLCAAPGGKSSQLAAAMAGLGTLVCNEPVASRAQVLSRNLERMGVRNAVAVCADPERLAQVWPLLFDAVLVDAPCSGEGMFRRHPEARLEWDEKSPERCATRQRRILECACAMLAPGGRLCYSTCTFSPEENEQTVEWLLEHHPELEPVPFALPVNAGETRTSTPLGLRLYPHQVNGEGHFMALLRKTTPGAADTRHAASLVSPSQALGAPDKQGQESFRAFWADISASPAPVANAALGDTLLLSPPLPPLRGIRVLRAGCSLGQCKGKWFSPDHALALAAPAWPLHRLTLDLAAASAYLRGETLPAPEGARGYAVLACAGYPLGFAKASDGWLKNHYPKGLRKP